MGCEPVTALFWCVRRPPSKSFKSIKPVLKNRCGTNPKAGILLFTSSARVVSPGGAIYQARDLGFANWMVNSDLKKISRH
jgi:hypothetical protein